MSEQQEAPPIEHNPTLKDIAGVLQKKLGDRADFGAIILEELSRHIRRQAQGMASRDFEAAYHLAASVLRDVARLAMRADPPKGEGDGNS